MPPPPRFKKPALNGLVTVRSLVSRERCTEAAIRKGELVETLETVALRLGLHCRSETAPLTLVDENEMPLMSKLIDGGEYYVSGGTEANPPANDSGGSRLAPDLPVAWAFDARVLLHEPSTHRSPETPHRLARAVEMLQNSPRAQEILPSALLGGAMSGAPSSDNLATFIAPRLAEKSEILSWHDKAIYEAFLDRGTTLQNLISDVYCNEGTSSTAVKLSAAAVIDGSEMVLQSIARVRAGHPCDGPLAAMCLVRPPGHHCTASQPSGFCLINNVAVACQQVMQKRYTLDRTTTRCPRIAIIDLDVHFGEGTAEFVEHAHRGSQVGLIYMSIHRFDEGTFYPADARGATSYHGSNCIFNVAVDTCATDPNHCERVISDYLFQQTVERVFIPRLDAFQPDLVIISQGFDAAYSDPLGRMSVEGGFAQAVMALKRWCFASPAHPRAGLVIALEGGYNPEAVSCGILSIAYALSLPERDVDVQAVSQSHRPRTWDDVRHKIQRQRIEQQQLKEEADTTKAPFSRGDHPEAMVDLASDDVLFERHTQWCSALLCQVCSEHEKAVH